MRYFDSHSHIHFPQFAEDRDTVLARMKDAGVSTIVVGCDSKTSEEAVSFAHAHDLYAAVGLHPADNRAEPFNESLFRTLLSDERAVALGECGLDFYRLDGGAEAEKHRQRGIFEAQAAVAIEMGKPLMIHCRDAHKEVLDVLSSLKREHGDRLFGVVHFFTAPPDIARAYLSLDFRLSFPGVITFARDYDESVRIAPLSHILSETDAPYASPIPMRGKRCEPSFVPYTVAKLAQLRGEDEDTVRLATLQNAERLFGISLLP